MTPRHTPWVAARDNNAVSIIDITTPASPSLVANVTDGADFEELEGASNVAITEIDSKTYAVVAARHDHGVQIIDITDPAKPSAVASVKDGADFPELEGALDVAITQIDSKTYAVVTALVDFGVQIIDITNASNPLPVSDITDGEDGFDLLNWAQHVAITEIGSLIYAVVASDEDDAVSIIDITDPANPLLAANVTHGQGGFETLDGATGIAIAEIGSRTYAVVTAFSSDGIQIIDISDYAPPVLSRASLNHDTDVLSLTFNEAMSQSDVDPSGFTINGGDSPVPLAGATVSIINSTTMSLALTAGQAESLDSIPLPVLDVGVRAVKDTANNGIAASQGNAVEQLGTFNPFFISASLDEATGVLTVEFNKPLDPDLTKADPSMFAITESDGTSHTPLTGAAISSVNDTAISLALDVPQIADIRKLATPTLDIGAGAVQDAEENQIAASSGNMIHVSAMVGPYNPLIAVELNAADDNLKLDKATGVAVANIDSKTYALVAAYNSDALQILDITNVSSPIPVSNVTDDVGGFTKLDKPTAVAVANIDSKTYALVTAEADHSVSIINITDPQNPILASHVTDGVGDFTKLENPQGVAVANIGSKTYALVGAYTDDAVTIIDITDPENPLLASHVDKNDATYGLLNNPTGIAVTNIGSKTYAVVAAEAGNGIKIMDITNASDPKPGATKIDGSDGFNSLAGAIGVAITNIDSITYAVIAAEDENAVSILDITNFTSPRIESVVRDGNDGFEELDGAHRVAITNVGSEVYAVVVSRDDNGVQIMDITDPANPISAYHIDNNDAELWVPDDVAISNIGYGTYALIVTEEDDGLVIMDISDYASPVLSDVSLNGTSGTLLLRFDEPVNHTGIDMSGFTVGNEDGTVSLALAGATTTMINSTTLSVMLTPAPDRIPGIGRGDSI